jgi:hypothetical protein
MVIAIAAGVPLVWRLIDDRRLPPGRGGSRGGRSRGGGGPAERLHQYGKRADTAEHPGLARGICCLGRDKRRLCRGWQRVRAG